MSQPEIILLKIKCSCGNITEVEYNEKQVEVILDYGIVFIHYKYTCEHCNKINRARIG